MLSIELSNAERAIYKDLSKQMAARTGSSADFIRSLVRIGHNMVQNKKTEINVKIDENNDTLSKRLADEANEQLKSEIEQYIIDIKTVLSKRASDFFDAKKNSVNQFIKQMPSDNLGEKLKYVCEYGHLFSKTVWEVFITDSDITGNYIAQTIVQKMAEKNGIDYVCPFNYERVMEKLNDIETMTTNSINNLDKGDSLTLLSFISENENSPVSKLIADLDSDMSTIIPAEKLTVLKRLKNAKQNAYDQDAVELSVKIGTFIDRNIDRLATPEEINNDLYAQAENLINQGMSAKKGRE